MGQVGLIKTVPDGMKPGSDVANLSVLGFEPEKYYTGRSPLEALSMGINMGDEDVAVRTNLVTLSEEKEPAMLDYSAGEISTEEARELIGAVQKELGDGKFYFYAGVAYRHCLIVKGEVKAEFTPPHDISGKKIAAYLPKGLGSEIYRVLMENSRRILSSHPVNIKRIEEGKRPANSLWFWGAGKRPALDSFEHKFGIKGAVISAVDLLKGIAKGSGMNAPDVRGALGNLKTDFDAKIRAAIEEFESGAGFVYVHIEAPDECSHQGDLEGKIKAIGKVNYVLKKTLGVP